MCCSLTASQSARHRTSRTGDCGTNGCTDNCAGDFMFSTDGFHKREDSRRVPFGKSSEKSLKASLRFLRNSALGMLYGRAQADTNAEQ